VGEHERPRLVEVRWSADDDTMTARWADGHEDHEPATIHQACTFAFGSGLRLCRITPGGGLRLRHMADCD
jgi:hypothetical protein